MQEETFRLLSWDVGIINMAYCLLEKDASGCVRITEWDVFDLTSGGKKKKRLPPLDKLRCALIDKLEMLQNECDTFKDLDEVIIESQPAQRMKIMAGCLYDYFYIRGWVDGKKRTKVQFVSPRMKLCTNTRAETCTYTQRKKLAIHNCQEMIAPYSHYTKLFNKHKKKDDLCDSMLQGFQYIASKDLDGNCSLSDILVINDKSEESSVTENCG